MSFFFLNFSSNFAAWAALYAKLVNRINREISFEAKINPKLAGIENRSESSKDLFCISEIFLTFFILKALERTGKETVPTAIPAIARLI